MRAANQRHAGYSAITTPIQIAYTTGSENPQPGGGVNGQAGALRLGIARTLLQLDPELRGQLKAEGYLTRDAREKERRKYGLKKARKAPQYSKR